MLDDISVLAQVAAKKAAGILGDDLALNAQQVAGALGIVWAAALRVQVGLPSGIAVAMRVGVYGVVACNVKLDDFALFLIRQSGESAGQALAQSTGRMILWTAPLPMRSLTVLGTLATFLVGGEIRVTRSARCRVSGHGLIRQGSSWAVGWPRGFR